MVLLNMTHELCLFDVASIVHFAVIQCMVQSYEYIQQPRVAKPVLVLSSPITKIYFNNGNDLSPTNTITHQMISFMDTTIKRSISALQDRQEQQGRQEQAREAAHLLVTNNKIVIKEIQQLKRPNHPKSHSQAYKSR